MSAYVKKEANIMNRKVRRENMATVPLRPIDGTSSIKKAVNMPMLCQKKMVFDQMLSRIGLRGSFCLVGDGQNGCLPAFRHTESKAKGLWVQE
jgi:hypothetical protein